MKYKKFLVLGLLFCFYVVFVNFFGNYSLVQNMLYQYKIANPENYNSPSQLFIVAQPSHQLAVQVIRARVFCLSDFCLLPTYIYFPVLEVSFSNIGLHYWSEWREVRIKSLNYYFLLFLSVLVIVSFVIEFKKKKTFK